FKGNSLPMVPASSAAAPRRCLSLHYTTNGADGKRYFPAGHKKGGSPLPFSLCLPCRAGGFQHQYSQVLPASVAQAMGAVGLVDEHVPGLRRVDLPVQLHLPVPGKDDVQFLVVAVAV